MNSYCWNSYTRGAVATSDTYVKYLPKISNQPPRSGGAPPRPALPIQTRVQSAPPARLSEALRRWSTNHRGSSDKSTPTQHTHAGDICHTLKQYTLTTHGDRVERRRRRQWHARADGLGRGGAATAWAAAALSARARRLCAARARSGAQGSVAARGRAAAVASRRAARARRGGQVIGRRVMGRRVTAPSDRRRRAGRRSAAADLEGVRSATVGVGGRPSCGEEGGRQVRVVRVALHRPVERHSSRDQSKA